MKHPWQATSLLFATLLLAPNSLTAQPAKTAEKKPAPVCDRANFRIILDVGHSAEVPGALSARGIGEYTFNLNLARVVEKKLHEAGFSKAHLLVTPGKAIAGLVSRVHFASRNPADLFLAIHHDAVPDKFLQKWTYEGKEHAYCDRFKGHSLFVSRVNEHYKESLQFARFLGYQLKQQGLQYATQYTEKFMGIRQRQLVDPETGVYRFDNLVVLMSTNMPAVLFEAGSIINREEELVMADPKHQELLASAVTRAVESFCTVQAQQPKPEAKIRRAAAPEAQPQQLPFFGQPR
jgi:N-acetylmuramoyl-L-alanine amidase